MATKDKPADMREEPEESGDSPLIDNADQTLKKMITRGREHGHVYYHEISKSLPPDKVSPEKIDDVVAQLAEMGINVIEGEEALHGWHPLSGGSGHRHSTGPQTVRDPASRPVVGDPMVAPYARPQRGWNPEPWRPG